VNTANRSRVEAKCGGDFPRLEQPMRKFLSNAQECQATVFRSPCVIGLLGNAAPFSKSQVTLRILYLLCVDRLRFGNLAVCQPPLRVRY
jgi:hypothetical protein